MEMGIVLSRDPDVLPNADSCTVASTTTSTFDSDCFMFFFWLDIISLRQKLMRVLVFFAFSDPHQSSSDRWL